MSEVVELSYLTQRKVIGWLGLFLPLMCLTGGWMISDRPDEWWYSLSATYHLTPVLTMMLSCTAIFLMTYKGYDRGDRIINFASGVCALFVILFPCNTSFLPQDTPIGFFQLMPATSHVIHTIAASVLFALFSVNILVQFTKGNSRKKNRIFRICGWSMVVCLVCFLLVKVFHLVPRYATMIVEAILLILFGVAWLVKGKMIEIED
ncbi:MAG: hypothetical protein J6T67_07805 [Paludibacteraceae bacterium]|nr:hypothetical protein [Paludibacteraceae bacterium]MBR4712214.1 hypothetical protein [Paludibacteraceae bacterium]MBR5373585.1 hypothetical protein [Paludibacteraceae bacterium]